MRAFSKRRFTIRLSFSSNPLSYIRWIENPGLDPKALHLSSDTKIVQDVRGNYLLLFTSQWNINWALEKNEGLRRADFSRQ